MTNNRWDISLLYVEDEKILRSIYEKVLAPRVSQFYLAENGEEGFQLFLEHKPDLVITDIKMPIMNGLDLMRKIKKQFPEARVIIMSAYGESHYFMRAIENGVKGFLLKPVDNDKLLRTIDEQAREIQLEKSVLYEESMRKKAEAELRQNEIVLQSVSDVAEIFLQQKYNNNTIQLVLKKLGEATDSSRVYYFENYTENGVPFCRQVLEWVSENVEPQINNEALLAISHDEAFFSRWVAKLGNHEAIFGPIKDFPEAEREILEPQGIQSLLAVPVFIQSSWQGFIGFDDCFTERRWSPVVSNTLGVAANIMGAAAHRARIEEQLRNLNAELEQRVEKRTRQLQKEISERKQTEILLRSSEEKYRLIFENANDGIFLSSDGQIRFINPKAFEITGYLPKMVIGKPFTDFIHPDYREMVLDNHYRRLRGEAVEESYDIKIIDAQKKVKWVELKSNLIHWDDEPSVLTFMTDIDTRKRYEEDLKELNQHLEARVKHELKQIEQQQQLLIQKSKLESLGELSAGVAHEVNQPLGGLSMSLDNILFEMSNKELTNEYVSKKVTLMFDDIERIRKIINHIRAFSRDRENQPMEAVNIIQVVNNTLSLVNRLYIDHLIDLNVSLDMKHCYFVGNSFKLEQVLLNLLSNAKFAVEQQALLKGPDFVKRIQIKSWADKGKLHLEIADNGVGIAEENLTRIFDPFFSTKKAEEGTGLGLSISYGLMKEMNGSIAVESKVGAYTKLLITLPEYINTTT
ncbi:MAG: response regulator [Bacteroidales bacterium]|nr:response regulator [Bacteroidales bacterium]